MSLNVYLVSGSRSYDVGIDTIATPDEGVTPMTVSSILSEKGRDVVTITSSTTIQERNSRDHFSVSSDRAAKQYELATL